MTIGVALLCQKDDWRHQLFSPVFVDNMLSLGYVNGVVYMQNILGSRGKKKYGLAPVMRQTSTFWTAAVLPWINITGRRHAKGVDVYSFQLLYWYACRIHFSVHDYGVECKYAGPESRQNASQA